jgi:hypothetical protein
MSGPEDGSISFLTAAVIEGLRRWKDRGAKVDTEMFERALKDLSSHHMVIEKPEKKDGFSYDHVGDCGSGPGNGYEGRSVQCALALLEAGRGQAALLEKCVDSFFRMRGEYVKARTKHEHTLPFYIAGYYYYHAHYFAARAIARLGKDPHGNARTIRRSLLEEQDADGSWYDAPCGHKTYGTALALLTLSELRGLPTPWLDSLELGVKTAGEDRLRVLLLVTDGERDPAGITKAVTGDDLRDVVKNFCCVRLDLCHDDPLRRKLKISNGVALVVLDPAAVDPTAKPLQVWTSKRTVQTWHDDLERGAR